MRSIVQVAVGRGNVQRCSMYYNQEEEERQPNERKGVYEIKVGFCFLA